MPSQIELRPIEDLFEKCFYIPDYQRGYRWVNQQIEDLLNDLEEFKENIRDDNDKRIYCLQPLVVKENKDKMYYVVIDGQQRLTTLKILLSCLKEKNKYNKHSISKGRQ